MSDDVLGADFEPVEGWVDHRLREEFPELRIVETTVTARQGRSPRALRDRLRRLADRFHGAHALVLRTQPIPSAYRVFFREIGLDPDADRTPVEAAAMERLMRGGFRSHGVVADALLLALVETGVPVWALDHDRLDGPLGLRPARSGERLGRGELASDLPDGRLVVADAAEPVAVLFGAESAAHAVMRDTTALRLYCVRVAGVPEVHVSEALWLCAGALADA